MISIQKLFYSIFILFLTSTGVSTSYSQQKAIAKSSKISEDDKQKRQNIKEQAISNLKDILLDLKSIGDIEQRAYVAAEASKTLWKYDQPFAKDSLLIITNDFISDYDSIIQSLNKPEDARQKLKKLNYAVKILLRAVAKNDLKAADNLQKKFFKIKENQISGENDLNEKLKTAQEGEEFDIEQSVNLIGKIIEFGIPNSFPQYLFDLKKKNSALADDLYRQALFNLSAKPIYSSKDAVHLSVYAFNESALILPFLQENKTDDFFIFNTPVSPPTSNSDKSSITGFIASYQNFLNSRLQNQSSWNFIAPDSLLQAYFLNRKLKAYNRLYNFGTLDTSDVFEASLLPLAQNAGLSIKSLNDVTGYADRLALNNNPLGLSDGADLFEKAEKSNDPREKLRYTIEGILRLIETRKFTEAESKILTISVYEIKDSLTLLLNVRASLFGIERNNWEEFDKQVYKISDKQIKAYLYVKALYVLDAQKQRKELFADYLRQAEKNLEAIEDKKTKAKGLFTLSALILASDQTEGRLILFDALKALNYAPDFREDSFEITVKVPGQAASFMEFLYKDGFEKSFMQLAKIDWSDSQIQTVQIKSTGLKAIAQVAAIKSALQ